MGKNEQLDDRLDILKLVENYKSLLAMPAFIDWMGFVKREYDNAFKQARRLKDPVKLAQADMLFKIYNYPKKMLKYEDFYKQDVKELTESLEP